MQNNLKSELGDYDIKWEEPEKFHLTLRFLGKTDENTVQKLVRDVRALQLDFDKIRFETKGINFFPNAKRPRVIFLDLNEFGENSKELADRIEETVEKYGFEKEKQFVPHVTLGRFRRHPPTPLQRWNIEVGKWEIDFDSFCLMKSELSSKGSRYSVIKEFKLGSGDSSPR